MSKIDIKTEQHRDTEGNLYAKVSFCLRKCYWTEGVKVCVCPCYELLMIGDTMQEFCLKKS